MLNRFKKVETLGTGDIKLMSTLAVVIDYKEMPTWFFMIGIIGFLTSILWFRIKNEKAFPFAPAIILGFLTIYFYKL